MNFPTINQPVCLVPVADSCSGAAAAQSITLKPSSVVIGILGTTLFQTFLEAGGGETLLSAGLVYSSSNPGVLAINATTGNATGIAAGVVTISVAWQGMSAFAQVTVMAGDYCANISAAMLVRLDCSKSMGIEFDVSHGSRLAFAKLLSAQFISEVNYVKDHAAFAGFDIALLNESLPPFGMVEADLLALSDGLPQGSQLTRLEILQEGLDQLNAALADRKILVLFSDGEDTASVDLSGFLASAETFKSSGGIILVVGMRASGAGFTLLSNLASGGFFINAIPENADDVPDLLSGLKGCFCAGACGIGDQGIVGYGTGCLGRPLPAQIQDLNPPAAVEDGTPPPGSFTSTRSYTASCPYVAGIGSAVPIMASNTNPSGVVTDSGEIATFEGWRAFGSGNPWRISAPAGWLAYEFTEAQTITSFAIETIGATAAPFTYQFWIEGSTDGLLWVILAHPNVTEVSTGATAFLPITNPGSYTHYRLRYALATSTIFGVKRLTYYVAPKSVTRTATRTSSVSQQDADAQALQAAMAAAQAALQCCTNALEIIDQAPATPYPACFVLAGFDRDVSKLTVEINGFTHPNPADVCMVLVGPGGQMIRLMSGCGGAHAAVDVNLVFEDGYAALTTAALASGHYAPTGLDSIAPPLPCPQPPYAADLSVFNGIDPNGEWHLFVVDSVAGNAGSIQSWDVVIVFKRCCGRPGFNDSINCTPPTSPSTTRYLTKTMVGDGFCAQKYPNNSVAEGSAHVERTYTIDCVTGKVTEDNCVETFLGDAAMGLSAAAQIKQFMQIDYKCGQWVGPIPANTNGDVLNHGPTTWDGSSTGYWWGIVTTQTNTNLGFSLAEKLWVDVDANAFEVSVQLSNPVTSGDINFPQGATPDHMYNCGQVPP